MTPYQYIVLHQSCRKYPGLPVSGETHVVVLQAETSDQLEAVAARLRDSRVHHVLIREPDEPYRGAAVALGVEPTDRERVRLHVADLKVFR